MEQENNSIRLNQAYVHQKGNRYILKDVCLIKIEGEWVEGIIYQPGQRGVPFNTYVRTLDNFKEKFTMESLPDDFHDTKSFTAQPNVYARIKNLQAQTDKDDYQVLAAMTEETGELAGAMSIEDELHGKAHKTVDEPSTHEAVDVVITALALFFQRGGTEETLNEVMNRKLDKWEQNIKPIE